MSSFNEHINNAYQYFFRNRVLPYLSIIIFTSILYYPSFECYFMTEDFTLIEDARNNFSLYNSFVTEFLSPQFYRPVTRRVFFSISHALFALNPAGYRFINIVLFILNNFLVYEIANILTKRKAVALLSSIFYLTRAAHLIAIYWITVGFQDNGVVFWVLCTLLLYLQYCNSKNKLFYLVSLACSVFALLSKEISIVLPAVILLTEIYMQTSKRNFNFKIMCWRVIPFFLLASLIYVPRLYILRPLMVDSPYKMQFSFNVLCNNIAFYVSNSFNNYIEMFLLGTLSLLAFFDSENRKCACFSIALFLTGLLPQLFIAQHPRPYYLNISLIGFSILLALGMEKMCGKFRKVKYLAVIVLISICIISARMNILASEYVKNFYKYETFIKTVVSDFKNSFPSLPDNSLIYIKNVTPNLVWIFGYGSVLSLHYNNKPAVYFEGISRKLPDNYARIYYFKYETDSFTLKFQGEELKKKNK